MYTLDYDVVSLLNLDVVLKDLMFSSFLPSSHFLRSLAVLIMLMKLALIFECLKFVSKEC